MLAEMQIEAEKRLAFSCNLLLRTVFMSYLYRDVTVPGREKCRGPVHTEEVTQPSEETHVALGYADIR